LDRKGKFSLLKVGAQLPLNTRNQPLWSISCNDAADCNSFCPTVSHLFQVKKKKLNFCKALWTIKGKFSSQKVGLNGAQLHLCTRNEPLGLISCI
jgi:hypothetical protein